MDSESEIAAVVVNSVFIGRCHLYVGHPRRFHRTSIETAVRLRICLVPELSINDRIGRSENWNVR